MSKPKIPETLQSTDKVLLGALPYTREFIINIFDIPFSTIGNLIKVFIFLSRKEKDKVINTAFGLNVSVILMSILLPTVLVSTFQAIFSACLILVFKFYVSKLRWFDSEMSAEVNVGKELVKINIASLRDKAEESMEEKPEELKINEDELDNFFTL